MIKYEYTTRMVEDENDPIPVLNMMGNMGWTVLFKDDNGYNGTVYTLERKFETEWQCEHEDSERIGPRSPEGYYKCHDCGMQLMYRSGDEDE